jgi:hypothetical protein
MQEGAAAHATRSQHQIYSQMTGLLSEQLKAEEAAGKRVTSPETAADPKAVFQAWGDNSRAFLDMSGHCFEWAVASVNGQTSAPNGADSCPDVPSVPIAPATSDARMYLAKVSDDPNFSYGAPKKHVWSVPLGPHCRGDQLYKPRSILCETHYTEADVGDRLICSINPTAHPNVKGAEAYRESITGILESAWAANSIAK